MGTPVELKWNVTGADSISIDGIGTVSESGVTIVTPFTTTIYTLRASNATGETVRQDAVFVSLPSIDLDFVQRPRLSFSITPTVIKTKPPQAEMKWSITDASEGEIEYPNGDRVKIGRAGALLIHPTESGIYTLRASNIFGETKVQEAAILDVVEESVPGPDPATLPPVVSLSAFPLTVRPGETVFITWSIYNATVGQLLLPNQALRPVGASGSDNWQANVPAGTYELRLQADNGNGPAYVTQIVVVSG